MSEAVEPNGWRIWAENIRGRNCGSCKLCCTVVPVELPSGVKPAGEKCRYLCGRGCKIYERRPDPCRWWSCKWLFDPMTAELKRPDLSGYIVDPTLDTVLAEGEPINVVQVWIDPKRPDAHRAPELRHYLQAVWDAFKIPALIRFDSQLALTLVPPNANDTGEWLELDGTTISHAAMDDKLEAGGHPSRFLPQG